MQPYCKDLKGDNLASRHYEVARAFAATVARDHHILGVVLLGGSARGFADQNSDIDLAIFVSSETVPLRRLRGEHMWHGFHVDVAVVTYRSASTGRWSMDQRSAYADAIVIHDPSTRIARLLRHKVVFPESERTLIAVDRIMRLGWYGISYREGLWRGYRVFKSADFWLRRGDVASAHLVLTAAIDLVLDLLYACNGVLVPHEKWKLHAANTLDWLPACFHRRLTAAITVRGITAKEFRRRLKMITSLYKDTVREVEKRDILPRNIRHHLVTESDYWCRP